MTFYFYDLETSGLDPKWHRIMQFAGQRVNENLEPVSEPHNILIKLSEDVLPDPGAILVTGITPQITNQEGITEEEFLRILHKEVFLPGTIMCGFNSIRFDDEFLRYTLYRNYFDPYQREWMDEQSRWDIVDLVRMTRALRPNGINWPTNQEGSATNRLEEITKANDIKHSDAHDALSDVRATVEIAKLIKQKQSKLFDHYLDLRLKKNVQKMINLESPQPLVHSSGKLSSDFLSTTVVYPVAKHPTNPNAILVFDLRYDAKDFADLDEDELKKLAFSPWQELASKDLKRLPVKAIHINKSPAIAPLGVLDDSSQERIKLTLDQINTHLISLKKYKNFPKKLESIWQYESSLETADVDGQLYDGFIGDNDKKEFDIIHRMSSARVKTYEPKFKDKRLQDLWIRYKARNYPESLTQEEKIQWDQFRAQRFASGQFSFAQYATKLAKAAMENQHDSSKQFLLEELQLWAESIAPFENQELL